MTEAVEKDASRAAAMESGSRASITYLPLAEERAYLRFKRCMDVLMSAAALLVLSPLLLLVATLVVADSRGPVLFRQRRVGRHGEIFECLKFRTMFTDAPSYCSTEQLKHPEDYITRVGRVLRRTSLDELPQLINILRGEMSVIGPRPLIPEERAIHEMRMRAGVYELTPGLTGWAQVNGRDFLSARDKVELDSYYAEHVGFGMDARVFIRSIHRVLACKDINEGGRN